MEQKGNTITLASIAAILLVAGAITFLVYSNNYAENNKSEREQVFASEEAVTALVTLDGESFSFDQFEGRVHVVNAWATWCPFCVNELPDFNTLAEEFKDQEVAVIAINRKEDPRNAKAFVEKLGGLPSLIFVMDTNDHFYNSIGGFAMPETIFFDADGNVAVHKRGFMSLEEMRTHVETALAATNNE